MMYLRLIIISYIFNVEVVKTIMIPFLALAFICAIITLVYYKKASNGVSNIEVEDSNPLELGTAFIFAFLFISNLFLLSTIIASKQALSYSTGLSLIFPPFFIQPLVHL